MDLVLIHGSYFGPWCWELVIPELERLGHRAVAPDLPISEPGLGASAYADAIVSAIRTDEPPVVVAHSMAGLVAPLMAAEVPVRRLVFLAAFLPVPGKSAMDQRSTEPIDPPAIATTSEWTDLGEDVWSIGPDTARELFLHDVAGDVAASAIERLRPQCYRVMTEMTPLTAWPDVPSDYVVCADDRALSAAWGRRASRDRLGVGAIELPGGHCPMLSRPDQLAATLDRLARGS